MMRSDGVISFADIKVVGRDEDDRTKSGRCDLPNSARSLDEFNSNGLDILSTLCR